LAKKESLNNFEKIQYYGKLSRTKQNCFPSNLTKQA
jgi:hypothetical protein